MIRGGIRFYPYAQMQSYELAGASEGSCLRLRITMKPPAPGQQPPLAREMAIPKRIDIEHVREILRSAGVVATGLEGS